MGRTQRAEKVAAQTVPRKAAKKPSQVKKRKSPDAVGASRVRVWKNGTGEIHVGKGVVETMLNPQDVADWTDEELMQGARRTINGHRPSRIPHVIPTVVYMELVKRMVAKTQHRFAAELEVAVSEHIKIIKNKNTKDSTRLRAIEVIYDRVMGKAPEHVVHHTDDAPWLKMISSAVVGNMDQARELEGEIIDGEVVEDEDSGQESESSPR